MRAYTVNLLMKHAVLASPKEVIENYIDYGHEVFAHGKYSGSGKKHVSKITKVDYRILSPTRHEVRVPVVLLGGLIKSVSVQNVTIIPWTGLISEGKNFFGLPMKSRWFIWRDPPEPRTQCWVIYEIGVPWFLFFLEPVIKVTIRHLRNRIWEEDRIMLERRDRLMKMGFGDWGKRPESRLEDRK